MRTALLLGLVPALTLAVACQTDGSTPTNNDDEAWGEVAGVVTAVDGTPLEGVSVTLQDMMVLTDDSGTYRVDMVEPAHAIAITFARDGYAKTYGRADLISWETVSANAVMARVDGTAVFDALVGGKVRVDDVTIEFPPDAVIDAVTGEPYDGDVTVEVTHINPRTDELLAAPGDLRARLLGDGVTKDLFEDLQLVSYGMVDVTLIADQGDTLQLKQGAGAAVEMPIDQEGLATVYLLEEGDEEKVWSFDPESVIWMDEGTGTVVIDEETEELMFSFVATHFSWWNSDKPMTPTCAEGKVVDVMNFPVRGAEVVCGGASSTAITYTDADGMYECPVLAGDTVAFSSTTFVADRNWTDRGATLKIDCPSGDHFCEVDASGMDGACYPVPDMKIDVCREAGIVMADNLVAMSGEDSWTDVDSLRAWFWDPPGDVEECDDPWASIPLESCDMAVPADAPTSFPDIGVDGIPEDTKSVGSWFSVDNGRQSFQLQRELQDGRPIYVWDTDTFNNADGIPSADDLSFEPMDLHGGDPLAGSAPGDTNDGMGAIDQPDLLTIPQDLTADVSGDSTMTRGAAMTVDVNVGSHPDGLKVFAMTDRTEPAMLCRFADDGRFSIPGSATSAMSTSEFAGLGIFRTDSDWVAGPDGLPIRIQAFSGVAMPVEIE